MGRPRQTSKSHEKKGISVEILKLTRPKDINTFILADISAFQEGKLAHKVMATILEAGFCIFFDSLCCNNLPGILTGISFARLHWLVIPSLAAFPSRMLTLSLVVHPVCLLYRGQT